MDQAERAIFEEGFKIINKVEREEWTAAVEKGRKGRERHAVTFLYPDQQPFKDACLPPPNRIRTQSKVKPIYDAVQKYNEEYPTK